MFRVCRDIQLVLRVQWAQVLQGNRFYHLYQDSLADQLVQVSHLYRDSQETQELRWVQVYQDLQDIQVIQELRSDL